MEHELIISTPQHTLIFLIVSKVLRSGKQEYVFAILSACVPSCSSLASMSRAERLAFEPLCK